MAGRVPPLEGEEDAAGEGRGLTAKLGVADGLGEADTTWGAVVDNGLTEASGKPEAAPLGSTKRPVCGTGRRNNELKLSDLTALPARMTIPTITNKDKTPITTLFIFYRSEYIT